MRDGTSNYSTRSKEFLGSLFHIKKEIQLEFGPVCPTLGQLQEEIMKKKLAKGGEYELHLTWSGNTGSQNDVMGA